MGCIREGALSFSNRAIFWSQFLSKHSLCAWHCANCFTGITRLFLKTTVEVISVISLHFTNDRVRAQEVGGPSQRISCSLYSLTPQESQQGAPEKNEALGKFSEALLTEPKELRHPPTWLQAFSTAQCHLSARGQGLWVPRPCLSQTSQS